MLMMSINHEARVTIGVTTSSFVNPDVVVPMRPCTAVLGASNSSYAIRRVTAASIPVKTAVASGVKSARPEVTRSHSAGSILALRWLGAPVG